MSCFFFFNDTATTEIYTLSLHDALPICAAQPGDHDGADREPESIHGFGVGRGMESHRGQAVLQRPRARSRSEEHTSELQSPCNLVCRLLLEKKKPKDRKSSRLYSS